MSITALVPFKSKSTRLPGKNYLNFGDSNLIYHKIHQLMSIKLVSEIIVSSDDYTFLNNLREKGLDKVKLDYRPVEFTDDEKPFYKYLEYIIKLVSNDHIAWTPVTSPCLVAETIENSLSTYLINVGKSIDSLVAVTKLEEYIIFNGKPVNFTSGKNRKPTNYSDPVFKITNGLIVCPVKMIPVWKDHYGPNVMFYEISKVEAVDIDTYEDYLIALAFVNRFGEKKSEC